MSLLRWSALDTTADVEGPARLLEQLRPLLEPVGRAAQGAITAHVQALDDGDVLVDGVRQGDQGGAVGSVLTALNRVVLAQCRDLATHAAVLASGGRAVALPAVSGAGKSTLAAAGALHGLSYVSDEALVLTREGVVRAYPRPVSLGPWAVERLGLADCAAGDPGDEEHAVSLAQHAPAPGRVTVSDVVLPRRTGRVGRLEPASGAVVCEELLRRSFNHYRDPTGALAVMAEVVRAARCWTLDYADAVDAADVLRSLLHS